VRRLALTALALVALAAPAARAHQARPSEEDMFGGPAPATPDGGAPGAQAPGAPPPDSTAPAVPPSTPTGEPAPGAPPAAANAAAATPPITGSDRDQSLLGAEGTAPQHLSDYQAPENPLSIGGQLYLRTQTSTTQGQQPGAYAFSAPNLLDLYLDARPNPRVRAFVLGRMQFDPTAAPLIPGNLGMNSADNGGALTGTSVTGFSSFTAARGPTSLLDQMWIRFDVLQRVFVTAGKQHVRWGTGRFWQPTDYLHPVKRNPLDVFDARAGQSMVKLHVPWEARGWNFYGFGVTEDPNEATNQLRNIAGGARAEIVLFDAEIGLDVLAKNGRTPRAGVDFSTGIWEFDVYGDVGIRSGSDFCVVRATNGAAPALNPGGPCPASMRPAMVGTDILTEAEKFDLGTLSGVKVQAVGGINWSHKYNDNDIFTIGGEYFYNQPGYADTSVYPGLLLNSNFTPMLNFFYTGREYAALFASFPAPYSWNLSTFTVSTLGNLTDLSFVSRLDYAYTLLTHLSLEAFVGVHYGHEHGEFRLGVDLPNFHRDPSLLDVGIALRAKM
jgi:hypothetical protein